MRKDRVYSVNTNFDIICVECGCPAGQGPTGSCKHIGTLSYTIADFVQFRASPDYQISTDVLQQRNCPCSRKVDPIPLRMQTRTCSHKSYSKGIEDDL